MTQFLLDNSLAVFFWFLAHMDIIDGNPKQHRYQAVLPLEPIDISDFIINFPI